jgi:ABC-type uncharacterized transport system substrate-binding protein
MNTLRKLSALAGAFILSCSMAATAADKKPFPTTPATHNGQRWRIAYYEGGEYTDYQKVLTETVRGLMKLSWIENTEIPPQQGEQTKDLWKWLNSHAKSNYIEFVKDAHYTANWDDNLRKKTAAALIDRLNQKKDIDLLIAMGTLAGKDMANNKHSTNTLVLSASDALSAGIIKSIEDSGFAHVHAQVDPTQFERQIQVFHEMTGFKRLGVAYEDTQSGRSYAAMDTIEKINSQLNFDIVRCYTQSDISDVQIAENSVVECFQKLTKSADAIYVTQQGGVNQHSLPQLVKITSDNHIPTFSQAGSEEVKYGFLASLSQAGFRYLGEFYAETMAKVFNGAKPNELDQVYGQPPKIAINLKTAELIGFDPPLVLLGAADEIFRDIAVPK